MKAWIKGAILGIVWGVIGDLYYILSDMMKITTETFLGKILSLTLGSILGLPLKIAVLFGFGFVFVFIGAPIVGFLIGAGLGFLLEKWKGRK